MSAPAGFTTVSASRFQDATGTVIANGTMYFTPVDNRGNPISFLAGGAGGTVSSRPVQANVLAGVFSVVLADTTLTSPVNVGYSVSCIDNNSGNELIGPGYSCVQPSGSTWSFDTYTPNLASQITVQLGPAGPPLLPKGAWVSSTVYNAGDVVINGGQSFISLQNDNIGYAPELNPTWWNVLAQGFQLTQYSANLTFTTVGTVVVQHNLNTLTPDIQAFVNSGSTDFNVTVLDANNILVQWWGPATATLLVSVPQQFVNTAAEYDSAGIPTGGLVEYWPCADGSGSTLSNTATPANTMSLEAGAFSWAAQTGFPGDALTFGAISSGQPAPAVAAEVNPLSDIDISRSPITLACWVTTDDTYPDGRTFMANGRCYLGEQAGGFSFGNPGGSIRTLNTASFTGTKTHIAVTYDGSGSFADPHVIFYVNGSARANSYGPSGLPTSGTSAPWGMGSIIYGGSASSLIVAGQGVWNRVLLPSEIAHLFALGTL
jgi:Concanavalin A-like lectin/glucanases superfamily